MSRGDPFWDLYLFYFILFHYYYTLKTPLSSFRPKLYSNWTCIDQCIISSELTSIQSRLSDNKPSLQHVQLGYCHKLTKSPKLIISCNDTRTISRNAVTYLSNKTSKSQVKRQLILQKCKLLNTKHKRQSALCNFDYASSSWYAQRMLTKSNLQNKLAWFVRNKHQI